jgi:hypothetical protein
MVRIHNPVKGDKSKLGADNQMHGGTLEEVDQLSNAIYQAVHPGKGNDSKNNTKGQQ